MKISRVLLIIAAAFILSTSCSSTKDKQMTYFTDIEESATPAVGDYSVKIEPADELFITVHSENPGLTARFNLPLSNPATRGSYYTAGNPSQKTYIVDQQGYIDYPGIGKMKVAGLTVEQLRDIIFDEVSKVVDNPVVTVEMVNFMVNVAGEVNRPGRIAVQTPRFSILDAIVQAGDLNQYGRRDNVLLIREEDGVRKHIRFDLNSADVLSSPYFYLKQNDYLYVEPNNVRKDNAEYNQYNSYKLSVISTIVSGSASVISLIIALTR